MSFKPRLFEQPDEQHPTSKPLDICAETRDWFPTAELLAQQLLADSQQLARQYPPQQTTPDLASLAAQLTARLAHEVSATTVAPLQLVSESTVPLTPRLSRSTFWTGTSVAAAALLMAAGVKLWSWQNNKHDQPRPVAVQDFPRETPAIRPVSLDPDISPPLIFKRLSGAEQEAFLDLLEEQAVPAARLSI